MSNESTPTQEQIDRWHHHFAIETFNATWDLMDKTDRTSEDDARMLATAFASRYHWESVGGPKQHATGDWQISRVCCLLNLPDLALRYAQSNLDIIKTHELGDYLPASAYEALARAHACAGDDEQRDRYIQLSRQALNDIADPNDRAHIESQLRDVPGYRD